MSDSDSLELRVIGPDGFRFAKLYTEGSFVLWTNKKIIWITKWLHHVTLKMADEREPPPMEDSNENDDEDIFSEAKEVSIDF